MSLLGGLGLGAGLMYLLDPDRGKRRRSLLRDQGIHALYAAEDLLDTGSRDLGHRATGLVAELKGRLTQEEPGDEVLLARIRSKLGRYATHPKAIVVRVNDGVVTLSGPILAREAPLLIKAIGAMPGVEHVENRLEVQARAEELAGKLPPRTGQASAFMQQNWAPGPRLLATTAGAMLAVYGLSRRRALGALWGLAGLSLVARAVSNRQLQDLVGVSPRKGIFIQKTLTIDAPLERVFDFWAQFAENFPRFMSHVRQIQDQGSGRSVWKVAGPAGMAVEWEAEITKHVPNRVLAWRSLPGSMLETAGSVHFEAVEGGTRIHVQLSYLPPLGQIGHSVATLFGADPKHEMDEDLARMKRLIEAQGRPLSGERPQ
ncbi:MAG TPA: SRPBCC family protein [Stenomitos sp.]